MTRRTYQLPEKEVLRGELIPGSLASQATALPMDYDRTEGDLSPETRLLRRQIVFYKPKLDPKVRSGALAPPRPIDSPYGIRQTVQRN